MGYKVLKSQPRGVLLRLSALPTECNKQILYLSIFYIILYKYAKLPRPF